MCSRLAALVTSPSSATAKKYLSWRMSIIINPFVIKWFGHSCFLITADNGVSILTDPFDGTIGYKMLEVAADIVSTSHEHFDHNYIQGVQGDFFT
nr:MBL fold metallo-hydrolase [Pectinatus frisingensis]